MLIRFIWWLCIPKLEPILARSANEAPAPARASTRCAPPEKPPLELSNEFPPPIFYFLAERVGFSGWSPAAIGGGAVVQGGTAAYCLRLEVVNNIDRYVVCDIVYYLV